MRRSAGVTIRQFLNNSIPKVPGGRPLSSAEVLTFGAITLVASVVFLTNLKVEIDNFVWTGKMFAHLLMNLLFLLIAGYCALVIVKEMRFTWQGVPAHVYSAAQQNGFVGKFISLARRLLRAGKLEEARNSRKFSGRSHQNAQSE
jgi:hypothetical protein